jgi:DNA segregation ATPase FtsK/SpoIIIE, S-DNA-T family
MSTPSNKFLDKSNVSKELVGISLVAISLFLAMSLFSYSESDPSFTTAAIASTRIHNWCGIIGSYTADLFFNGFGLGSYLIPLVFLGAAINIFLSGPVRVGFLRVAGFALFMISSSGLFALFYQLTEFKKAGGIVGYFIMKVLDPYINDAGSFVILFALLCASIVITTQISLVYIFEILKELSFVAWKGILWFGSILKIVSRKVAAWVESLMEKGEEVINEGMEEIKYNYKEPSVSEPIVREKIKVEPREIEKREPKKVAKKKPIDEKEFKLPPVDLLSAPVEDRPPVDKDELFRNSRILENKLKDFGIFGRVVEVEPGPIITMYEFEPAPGVKLNKIVRLADDLAMALKALSVRIVAPIPGKSVVGIEIPNKNRETVYLKEIVTNDCFTQSQSILTLSLGKDTSGIPVVGDLRKMPHLLVAGATGTGKSVSVNSMIMSILFKAPPSDVKFIMVDPKMLELQTYEGIPHLLLPVVTDPKKAAKTLRWAVCEMERRYRLMADLGVRHIEGYNRKVEKVLADKDAKIEEEPSVEEGIQSDAQMENPVLFEKPEEHKGKLPYIVVVIDELADLMVVSLREVEESLTRLSQMARASGIHLILATQRPSVDVITGVIKANFPARISFQVASKVDARTILDQNGSEHLLGSGDMLFLPPGTAKIQRIHGAFVTDSEIKSVTDFLRDQAAPQYNEEILKAQEEEDSPEGDIDSELDEMYSQAVGIVKQSRIASISMIQRKLRIGYNRAARMIEKMEEQGIVTHAEAGKPREVIVSRLDQL